MFAILRGTGWCTLLRIFAPLDRRGRPSLHTELVFLMADG